MEKESKNGLDLIRISADKLKGSWGRVFLATLIYVAPLVLFCLIPYAGWAISVALFGYLTIGYINFMQVLKYCMYNLNICQLLWWVLLLQLVQC